MEKDIQEIINDYDLQVEQIPEDRQYWFLRTEGGLYYEDFFHNNFIAIGYNKIKKPLELLSRDKKIAYEYILSLYDVPKPGKIFNQIHRFYKQIKIDDVVMIPGTTSNTIAFGIVKSEMYLSDNAEKSDSCPFEKRRTVEWIKEVNRRDLDPHLYPMIRPHNTISNANLYGTYIDKTIHDFFIKGSSAHYIIDVKTLDNISLLDFSKLFDSISQAIDIANESNNSGQKYTNDDIKIKLNVQSPGTIELLTEHWRLMLIVGGLIGVIFGVDFSILGQKVKTDGIKGYIDKLSQQKHERRMQEEQQNHEIELKEMDHKHELERIQQEKELLLLKERLALQFPNEKAPSAKEEANVGRKEKKS